MLQKPFLWMFWNTTFVKRFSVFSKLHQSTCLWRTFKLNGVLHSFTVKGKNCVSSHRLDSCQLLATSIPIKSRLVNITSPALTRYLGWCFVNLTEARVSWEKDLDWVSALVKLHVGVFCGVFCWLMVDVGGTISPWTVAAMSCLVWEQTEQVMSESW